MTLSKEISYIIIIKLFLLTLLWWVCFSNPPQKPDRWQIEQHLLSAPSSSIEEENN